MSQNEELPVINDERPSTKDGLLALPATNVFSLNWEIAFYAILVIIAFVMRFWDLGTRALHHDESLHALYSFYLFSGRGYQHDPMMHGPFQFHTVALGYFLFGVSDYAARIVPALFGTVLVALPYFIRNYLGRTGAVLAAVMLAFSPSMLYYSRFIRNDIFIAVWTMVLVIALWRYMAERKNTYLYISAAAVSLSFATKEVTFITIAIFVLFFLALGARRLSSLFQSKVNLESWHPALILALFLSTFYLPQLSAGMTIIQQRLNLTFTGQTSLLGIVLPNDGLAGGVVVAVFLAIAAIVGFRFFGRVWLFAACIFYAIFVLLYTTFFTNLPGFGSGIWGSLGYWLLQHDVKRGDQPLYYYLVLLVIYEFLPVALALVATVYFILKRSVFDLFLIYWSAASLIAYAVAGEKMPWLLLHIALPLILLAARFLGQMVDRIDWRSWLDRNTLVFALLIPAILIGILATLRAIGPASGPAAVGRNAQGIALVLLLGLAVAAAVRVGSRLGRIRSLQVLGFASIGILFVFTIHSAMLVTYTNGDIPVEMLVYTQTSPEVPKIKEEIDRIALRSGQGKDIKITVDANSGFSWPWAWYLRDYKNVDYPVLTNMSVAPIGSILLLHDSNVDQAKPFLTKYGQPEKYHHRWWFPEDYRGLTPEKFLSDLSDVANWGRWWRYVLYREISNQLGSENGDFYVQKDLVGTTITRAAPPEPPREYTDRQLNINSVLTIGAKGSAPGQLNEPKGVAVDRQGNIFVMDSLNRRIQKFDANGKFLAQVGSEGSGDGEFMPNTGGAWGIAVDAEGFVYVADTWNHRIQKFDSDLRFVTKWGDNVDTRGAAQGNGGKFYGPRGIAVDTEGNIFVTDTGNHRVQKFNARGEFVGAFGGLGSRDGQFLEPVGIGVDADGNIYVVDTWNHRIQKFDKSFRFVAQIPVNGWESTGILNKPLLAVEPGGNILVTDPENHRLLRFSAAGTLLGVINKPGTDRSSFNMPIGVATDAQGNIYVSDSGNHRVQKFEALK
ncbi:MAG: TIGR03663 family protein [Dehalococcoidia bacterium]|nr:TIGR03663 family protein [Dehalococcoidia bacterium]